MNSSKFIAFAGWDYGPNGANAIVGYSEVLNNLVSLFTISEDGKKWYFNNYETPYDWWHIIRTSDMVCVGGSEDRVELEYLKEMVYQEHD